MKMSLCQIIAIVCILAMGTIGFVSLTPVSEAHPSKVKHVKNYDVTICTAHGTELSRMPTSTSYYILESHEEDPLHSSGSCSIYHDVTIITDENLNITYVFCPGDPNICPMFYSGC